MMGEGMKRDRENVLRSWRTRVLNGFLIVVAIASLPAYGVTILRSYGSPGFWPVAISFSVIELVLIVLAVYRRLEYRVRVISLLVLGYLAAIFSLRLAGLLGAAPLYLFVIPVVALILVGRQAGFYTTILSVFLAGLFAILFDLGILKEIELGGNTWGSLGTTVMLLIVGMALLIMFYRFQEGIIDRVTSEHSKLMEAQALLEEKQQNLEATVQARTAELLKSNKIQTALYKITDAASNWQDIQDFYREIHRVVGELMYARNIFIALYDKTSGLISFPYFVDEKDEPFPTQPLEDFHGMTSYMIRTGKAIQHGQHFDQLVADNAVQLEGTSNIDNIGAPLSTEGRVLGAIVVQSYTEGITYTQQDEELLGFVAQHIATALVRRQALEAERQRTEELAILNDISMEVSKSLDVNTLSRQVGDKMRDIFQASSAMIMLLDKGTNLIQVPYEFDVNEGGYIDYVEPFPLGTGLSSIVITTGRPLLVGTLEEEIANGAYFPPEIIEQGKGAFGQSWVGVPIITKGQVLGLMALADNQPHAFNENHLRLLQTLSSSIGAALDNAELFQQAKKSRADAEQANSAKSVFLANMSHELRTPLNAIIGFTRIVRRKGEGMLPDKQLENLDKVLISAENLLGLINDVLDISKIEAGRMDIIAANFRISALIELCANTAQTLLQPGVILEKTVGEGLEIIYSDQDKIRQIILNLLSNAAKFTPEGKISVKALRADEVNLHISVADTGIGISEDALPRIFKEFEQADSTTTRKYGGTGLGLAISRNLARLLGGDLTAESSLGEGSTFTLTIPIHYHGKNEAN